MLHPGWMADSTVRRRTGARRPYSATRWPASRPTTELDAGARVASHATGGCARWPSSRSASWRPSSPGQARPGRHGQHLAVSVALIVFAAGTIAVRAPAVSPTRIQCRCSSSWSRRRRAGRAATGRPRVPGGVPAVAAACASGSRAGAAVAVTGLALGALGLGAVLGHHARGASSSNEFGGGRLLPAGHVRPAVQGGQRVSAAADRRAGADPGRAGRGRRAGGAAAPGPRDARRARPLPVRAGPQPRGRPADRRARRRRPESRTRSAGPTGWPRPGSRRPDGRSACCATTRSPARSAWPSSPPSSRPTPAWRAPSPSTATSELAATAG